MSHYSTPQDLADEFQLSAEYVRRKAREGKWPHSRFGSAHRFSPEDREKIRDMVQNPVREPEPKPEGIRELVAQLTRSESK